MNLTHLSDFPFVNGINKYRSLTHCMHIEFGGYVCSSSRYILGGNPMDYLDNPTDIVTHISFDDVYWFDANHFLKPMNSRDINFNNMNELELNRLEKLQKCISLMYQQNPTQSEEFYFGLDKMRPYLSSDMNKFYEEIWSQINKLS